MKALLFGSIGVLADTSAMQLDAINRSFAVHDLDWVWSEAEYRLMLSQAGGQNRVRRYSQSVADQPLDERTIKSIHETKTRLFNKALEIDGVKLRPGILRLLESAKSAGFLTAWVTSTNMSNLHAIAYGSGELALLNKFSFTTHRGNVSNEKPHPAPYSETLKQLNITPADAIAIEDTQVCLASALSANLTTIVTPTTFSNGQDFSGATSVISHLGDPELPATHLSGRDVLSEGMASLAQLEKIIAQAAPSRNARTEEVM